MTDVATVSRCYSPYERVEFHKSVLSGDEKLSPSDTKRHQEAIAHYSKFTAVLSTAGLTKDKVASVLTERITRMGEEELLVYEDSVATIVASYNDGMALIERFSYSYKHPFGNGV